MVCYGCLYALLPSISNVERYFRLYSYRTHADLYLCIYFDMCLYIRMCVSSMHVSAPFCIAITAGSVFEEYLVTIDFTPTTSEHLSVSVGETVSVISKDSSGEYNSSPCMQGVVT